MIALTLAEIADAVGGVLVPAEVAGTVVDGVVTTDSREIGPGGVFVAKRGETTDGHLFVDAAVAAGAAVLVVDHELEADVPQVVVDDTVVALGELARSVLSRVRRDGGLEVVGITGSNGKTTTKNLLAAILSRVGETVAPRGSYNNEVGAPTTMLRVADTTRFLVAEMGASAVGDIRRLTRLAPPDVGVVLAVGLAHAGGFGSLEATALAKSEMVADLGEDDVAVLNADDPRVAAMADATRARVVRFGRGPSADVRAVDVLADREGTRFTLELPDGHDRAVRFAVLGEHHVQNALAAAAAAHVLGIGIDDIVAGLSSVARAERWRMEVMGGRGVTIVNDAYNASPDSMAAALRTLAQIAEPGHRTFAVLGEMSELGDIAGEEHDRVGMLAVRLGIDQVVVVGAGARRMHLATIAQGSWDGESVFVDTADEAFEVVTSRAADGDTVLVKSSNAAGLRFLGDRLGEAYS